MYDKIHEPIHKGNYKKTESSLETVTHEDISVTHGLREEPLMTIPYKGCAELFIESMLVVSGFILPYKAREKKLMMENCFNM